MQLLMRFIRYILNLSIAFILSAIAYSSAISIGHDLIVKTKDKFVIDLFQQYDFAVGLLGVFTMLFIFGSIMLLNDIGHWVSSWFLKD